MTVLTTTRETELTANGVTVQFDGDFECMALADVAVYAQDAALVRTLLVSGFTLSLIPNTRKPRALFSVAPTTPTAKIVLRRTTPKLQQSAFSNLSQSPAETIEAIADRLTMIAQEPEPGPTGPTGPAGPSGGATGPAGPAGPGVPTGGTTGQRLRKSSGVDYAAAWVDEVSAFEVILDGGGAVLTTGLKAWLEIPFACDITAVRLFGDQTGSIVVDIFKTTYAAYDPPTTPAAAGKITASAPPTISAAKKSQDTTLTGWSKSLAAGDVLGFNINSVSTLQKVTVALTVKKT